jgi:hypothetical protein
LVERNLAKVEVASSSLVSRSNVTGGKRALAFSLFSFSAAKQFAKRTFTIRARTPAGWQSGYAAACKAVYAGSIPTPASTS